MQQFPQIDVVENNHSLPVPHGAAAQRLAGELRIGGVRVIPATVLAPMAGVTDTVFRRLIRNQGGCGLLMTEFTSSHGVGSSARAGKPTPTFRARCFRPGRAAS